MKSFAAYVNSCATIPVGPTSVSICARYSPDPDGVEEVCPPHVAEAVDYRAPDRTYWA